MDHGCGGADCRYRCRPLRPTRERRRPGGRRRWNREDQEAAFVSQKILSICAIMSSSSWPVAGSMDDFEPPGPPPAFLVALLNSSLSSGYFSKCGGLK